MFRKFKWLFIVIIFLSAPVSLPLWGNEETAADDTGWLNRTIEFTIPDSNKGRDLPRPFEEKGLWGLRKSSYDHYRKNNIIRPPEFDNITEVSMEVIAEAAQHNLLSITLDSQLFITKKKGLFGILLAEKTVLENRFAEIKAAGIGHFIVKSTEGKYGLFFYDRIILPTIYEQIKPLTSFLFEVSLSKNQKGMVANLLPKYLSAPGDIAHSEFKELLAPRFTEIRWVNSRFLVKNSKGGQSVRDFYGKVVIENKYQHIAPYGQEFFKVRTFDDKAGIHSNDGEILLPHRYEQVTLIGNIHVARTTEEEQTIYHPHSSDGELLLHGKITEFNELTAGYYLVKEKNKGRGIATGEGWLIPPNYRSVTLSINKNARIIGADGKWAIEMRGKIIYPLSPEKPVLFSEDMMILFPHLIIFDMNLDNYFIVFFPLLTLLCVSFVLVLWGGKESTALKENFYITEKKSRDFIILKRIYPISRRLIYAAALPVILYPWGFLGAVTSFEAGSFICLIFMGIGLYFLKGIDRPRMDYFMKASQLYTNKIENFPGKLFRSEKLLCNEEGAKALFLVQKPNTRWYVVDSELNPCSNQGLQEGFDNFIKKTEEGVFILSRDDEVFYLYIKGKIPRVNKKL